jgi:tyrosine-protein kinase Etk/Wzc
MNDLERKDPDYRDRHARADDSVSLLDVVAVIATRKWLIVSMTAIIVVLTLGILVTTMMLPPSSRWNLLPNKYKPTIKILVQDTTGGSTLSSMLNQSGLGSLSGILGAGGAAKGTSADLAKALLKSKVIEDGVAEQFGFAERYHFTKYPKTAARRMIEGRLKSKYDEKSGIMDISYEDIDPIFATAVINNVGDRLQLEFRRLTIDKVTSKREYLEQSVAQAEQDTATKSAQLLRFQNKYGIYDLPAQAQANFSAVASLQVQLTSKQMELQLQRKYLPESDTRIVRLKDEISQLQKQISELKIGGKDIPSSTVPLNTMASLSVTYLGLQRDLQVQQAVLTVLKQQYETAKIEEMDNSRIFQVVETAEVPEMRSSPSRARIAVVAAFAGFLLSVLAAFVVEYFAQAQNDPRAAPKLLAIRASFGLRKKLPRE